MDQSGQGPTPRWSNRPPLTRRRRTEGLGQWRARTGGSQLAEFPGARAVVKADRRIKVPRPFGAGPTSRFGPTLAGKWDQEKPFEINAGPTGPTWTTTFFSPIEKRYVPAVFRFSSYDVRKKVGPSGTSGTSIVFVDVFGGPTSEQGGTWHEQVGPGSRQGDFS